MQYDLPDNAWLSRFRQRLRKWYAQNARDLAWRKNQDPYRVWLSEIMLQQTQVTTVIPYFERFTTRFPTVRHLAEADESEVLRLWEGLGYYRRARQLHAAAQKIVEQHGGQFPSDRNDVHALPGVGRYTAGAILSIALGQPEPILEANTIRLFARLLAFEGPTHDKQGQGLLWAMAEVIVTRHEPGIINQALMELGSEVCGNGTPRCEKCPVRSLCRGYEKGIQADLPRKREKPEFEHRTEVAVVLRRNGQILLLQQPEGGRWAGLWDFPRFQVFSENPTNLRQEIIQSVHQKTGLTIELGEHLKTIRHGVTRYKITLQCYDSTAASGRLRIKKIADEQHAWLTSDKLDSYPLSTTGRKIAKLL